MLKYPYRRVVGQLMYGMVHTMIGIMYALNVLSRYGIKISFSVRSIIPLFHPPIGVYTRYFLTLGAIMDFSRWTREKSIIARLEI